LGEPGEEGARLLSVEGSACMELAEGLDGGLVDGEGGYVVGRGERCGRKGGSREAREEGRVAEDSFGRHRDRRVNGFMEVLVEP
jgi:hypothetical protein